MKDIDADAVAGTDPAKGRIPITDEDAWRAVISKDPLMDGRFVYAVRTTGVFCRPTCTSRRPNRRNVSFFARPEHAAAAGYRACKRCAPTGASANSASVDLMTRMYAFLDGHLDEHVTLDKLGEHVGLSPWHVQRTFKRITGVSPREYVALRRTERMKANLRKGGTVSRAIYDAGFNSSSVVYESSARTLGMTPAAYRNGGRGVDIQFTIADCRLGKLLVAATDRGISSVAFGDDEVELEQGLAREFPNASVERGYGGFEDWVQRITSYLDGDVEDLDLPLNVVGTQFQQRVWNELGTIPYGSTRTYAEIARNIGSPRAVRAVASACASNKAALAIPCHRIVRSDGGLGGYKWGLKRKKAILETERRNLGPS